MKPRPKRKRRQRVLQIRFSEAEWERIHKVFPPRAVGTAMRALAMWQDPPLRSPALENRRKLLRQLARIGNNLNQIARGINRANQTGDKIETIKVLVELAAIRADLENF